MTQYNTLNVKLPNSQLNRLKPGTKNNTEVTLKLSSNVVGDLNNENNFTHKLFLTNTQISKLCITFVNNSSVNKKLLETLSYKIKQAGGISVRLLKIKPKTGLSLMENGLKPLAESVLIPLNLTTAAF